MALRIEDAQPDDAAVIATMVRELLHEIMEAVKEKAFGFHHDDTAARVRSWIADGKYTVLLARDGARSEPLGFLSLSESYALYTEGTFGTIPESFVRRCIGRRGLVRRY